MSAIWGCIHLKKDPVPKKIITLMKEAYSDCKIDKYTEESGAGYYMGAGIQYFVPEAKEETFPVKAGKSYLTADCLLDNRRELQAKLEDSEICDGKILAKAYQKWGIDCLRHLRGQFTFVVYEKEDDRIYLAVDQVAGRCLYYCLENEYLFFSTLLEPIRRVKKTVRWNRNYIADTLGIPGLRLQMSVEETPYEGIYKIPAGTYIEVKNKKIRKIPYWNPLDYHEKRHFSSVEKCGQLCKETAKRSVYDTLRINGKVGMLLSSGLDSSTVAGIAANKLKESNENLYTYTYVPLSSYEERNKFSLSDETQGVKLLGKMHNNMVQHFTDNQDCDSLNHMDKMISVLEMPYKAVQNMPRLYQIYEQAYRDGCRIVLNGHYGNVTFSYGNHQDVIYNSIIHGRIRQAYHQFLDFCSVNQIRKKQYGIALIKMYVKAAFCRVKNPFGRVDIKESYIHPDFAKKYNIQKKLHLMGFQTGPSQCVSQDRYRKIFYDRGDLVYLGEIATKMSLATGVLVRDPFQDIRVLELCADLPMEAFVHNGVERWLIRGNMEEFVPKELLQPNLFRGKQSADWLYRLQMHADENIEVMKAECYSSELSDFVDHKKVELFFKKLNGCFRNELFDDINHILYLTNLSIFLKKNPERK